MSGRYRIIGTGASEIARSVEARVADGSLPPGAALPPVRALAEDLGVAPGTVAAAYKALRDRGVVETGGRRGTRVRARPATTAHEPVPVPLPAGVRDVSAGEPDPALLPDPTAALVAAARLRHDYRSPDVRPALAAAARDRLGADGVPADALAVVGGALDGVERVLAAHLRPGDVVACEDPGWVRLLDLVGALGLVVEPVPVDDEGPLPDGVERALARGARALVVTVRAQNPTGAALSPRRGRELRRVLAGHPEVLLVEDDHAAEVAGADLVTLADAVPVWAHVRSVSKAWGPDLRVAVLAGDATTVDRVRGRQRLSTGWVSHVLQGAVAGLWGSAEATASVARARETYAARRAGLLAALAGRGLPAHGASGLNVWVPVADETAATSSLLAAGWAAAPGARFRTGSGPALRVTVAGLAADDVEPLAAALAAAAAARPGYAV
ncbi:MAG TPA: aminotransferase class I/II-fold pyridoxal phosphate-dependent enzyme [Motilibacteraceae bacterium]|nr:aminotransferase class I/II-fold pyridoxal phosphate-dependent enzyme [Motilibacteraceae bacterium]